MTLERYAARLRGLAAAGLIGLLGDRLQTAADLGAETAAREARARLRVRTGRLAASIRSQVREGSGRLVEIAISSSVPYASAQERGGTIRPRRGQYLAIPLDGSTLAPRARPGLFVVRSRLGNLLLVRRNEAGGITPVFVLKREIVLRGRFFLRAGAEAAERSLPALLQAAVGALDA